MILKGYQAFKSYMVTTDESNMKMKTQKTKEQSFRLFRDLNVVFRIFAKNSLIFKVQIIEPAQVGLNRKIPLGKSRNSNKIKLQRR